MPRESKTSVRRLDAVERQRQALELRKSGKTYEFIAGSLGYASPNGAYKAIHTALRAVLREPAEELRTLEVERLDALLDGLWKKAASGDTWSVDRALKIMERRANLLGLDAPKKIENTGKDGGPIRHEIAGPDYSNLTLKEQFELDQMLAKVSRE
jgi:hypothetical protein